MPDGSDPGRVERYVERQVERVRLQVSKPNQTDIIKTIRKGRRGNIPSPKRNRKDKPAWSKQTVRNNARNLRILAGQTEGLEKVKYEGTKWKGREGRDDYPDRLLDLEPDEVTNLIEDMSIARQWSDGTERDYCLSMRNLFLANDRIEDATEIDYPQIGNDDAAVDIDTVPTREDLYAIIEGESVRDKALYTTIWESGCRVTALASLKIKHWQPMGEGYGIIQLPGKHVTGLKGAEHGAKPITFARGYLDNWLAEHPLADDPDAPLFCPTRSQDDPSKHLHPHSIATQLYRIARRTDDVDEEHISPHAFKHGRASEMRASERFDKDDIEQILDWEEGTPMHERYTHVTQTDEAERILRKQGYEPGEDGGDPIEQHPCPRCGTMVDANADYCPSCSLRQTDGQPRWWRIYRGVAAEDDPVREQYDDGGDIPPATMGQLTPGYYEHVLDVLSIGLFQQIADSIPMADFGDFGGSVDGLADDPKMSSDDADWLRENYPEIEERQQEEHPASPSLRSD
ncbi:site-specific integrase [Natrinema altunense]|nr:site-specific integrase [Natrinema altunense]